MQPDLVLLYTLTRVAVGVEENSYKNGLHTVQLSCDKMKEDEPFLPFAVKLEKVELPNGTLSRLGSGTTSMVPKKSISDPWVKDGDAILKILESHFSETGATHS